MISFGILSGSVLGSPRATAQLIRGPFTDVAPGRQAAE
jgi:hypothetical protein